MHDWSELAAKVHALAVDKGWWEGGVDKRDVAEIVNNLHAEVSEAWEEWRAGRMDTWYSHEGIEVASCGDIDAPANVESGCWKPEGFWVEIADLCIRLLDTVGACGWELETPCDWTAKTWEGTPIPSIVSSAHGSISNMTGIAAVLGGTAWSYRAEGVATDLLEGCLAFAELHGVDLLALIDLKHAYNQTRAYRHGDKRA
jgi:hypothetical protein